MIVTMKRPSIATFFILLKPISQRQLLGHPYDKRKRLCPVYSGEHCCTPTCAALVGWAQISFLLGFGANNKNLLPTEPQISQIYLSSNAVTINRDSYTYPRRPNAGITPPHLRWWWSRCSRPQDHEELDTTMPQSHDASAVALAQRHSVARAVRPSTRTRTAHHDSFQIQSNRAAEEEVFGPEIWQPNSIRYEEYPLTRWHDSKRGSWAREKRGREVAHMGEERRALLGTPSIHDGAALPLPQGKGRRLGRNPRAP
jgi:hypothetical protein